jgi:hypothetical protein
MIDLKNYICVVPFTNMEIHMNKRFMCCASWILNDLPPDAPLSELWNSKEAIENRVSVMGGSYRHCDKTQCPYLAQILKTGKWEGTPVTRIDSLPQNIKKYVDEQNGVMEEGPSIIQMSFDLTCNFKCPSCRKDVITADSERIGIVNDTIEEITDVFGKDLNWIYVTGTGDPFVSVGFRKFLRNFDKKKFPKLTNIHLHTNASKWNSKMWDTMSSIHPYVKTCEISVDAGTKDTYEILTRVGGNWDELIENLKFINTIPKLKNVKCSFVIQNCNYKEMNGFLMLMKEIFGKKAHVFFGKINNWGTFTDEEFKVREVWDPDHPNFTDFVKEFQKVCFDNQVFHNMHEFVIINKKLI